MEQNRAACAGKERMEGIRPVVRLEGICKSFGKVRANSNITLDIRPTRIKALLGENGAGKSRPDSGRIYVDGLPARFRSPKDALEAGIGMVYQHFMLVEAMTVAQNILLGQESGIINPRGMGLRVRELAGRYGLETDPDALVADLSMGERQRVEILKLLYRDCRVLILDEPMNGLDNQGVEDMRRLLLDFRNRGVTILLASHNPLDVSLLCDQVFTIDGGILRRQ